MSTETLNVVEAKPNKTIEVIDPTRVRDILTNLSLQVQEKENMDDKLQGYLKTFTGKANLGIMAWTINRDFADAQKWRADELARKLGLTPIKKAQEAIVASQENASAMAQAAAQKKVAEAEQLAMSGKSPQTAQVDEKAISKYVGNSALKERERKAGL